MTAELEKRTQAFEMNHRRLQNILYKDHVTNEDARRKIQAAIGKYDELLTLIKKRKLRCFGHVSKYSGLAKKICRAQCRKKEEKVDRRRGGKIILRSGQGWTLLAQLGQLTTGLGGKGLQGSHMWCSNDLTRLWDRLD